MDNLCIIEGCNKKREGKGLCKRHYRRYLKYGDPLHNDEQFKNAQYNVKSLRVRYSREGKCVIEGCNNPIKARKLCNTHYNKAVKEGSMETKKIKYHSNRRNKIYTNDDIIQALRDAYEFFGNDLTSDKYVRWAKENKRVSEGIIKNRFGKWVNALIAADIVNSPEDSIKTRWTTDGECSVEGCNNPIKAKRLCNKHYARMYKAKKTK